MSDDRNQVNKNTDSITTLEIKVRSILEALTELGLLAEELNTTGDDNGMS